MAKYTINDTTLVAIADAIRAKSGTTGGIDPANMAALIEGIQAGGGSPSAYSATFIPDYANGYISDVYDSSFQPNVLFLAELGTEWADTTHTATRPIMIAWKNGGDIAYGSHLHMSSGSSNPKAEPKFSGGVFKTSMVTSASSGTYVNCGAGYIAYKALLPGRTYIVIVG